MASFSFLFVLSANASSVDVLSLKGPGQATHLQRLNIRSAIDSSDSKVPINRNNLQGMATYVTTNWRIFYPLFYRSTSGGLRVTWILFF
jgi:hypothetical protein